jgi:hypothetical protein
MSIPMHELGEVATAGIAVGAGAMKAIHELFGRYRKVTREDIREIIEEMKPKNGSTLLTKDSHAALCSLTMETFNRALEEKFVRVYNQIDKKFDTIIGIITKP